MAVSGSLINGNTIFWVVLWKKRRHSYPQAEKALIRPQRPFFIIFIKMHYENSGLTRYYFCLGVSALVLPASEEGKIARETHPPHPADIIITHADKTLYPPALIWIHITLFRISSPCRVQRPFIYFFILPPADAKTMPRRVVINLSRYSTNGLPIIQLLIEYLFPQSLLWRRSEWVSEWLARSLACDLVMARQ